MINGMNIEADFPQSVQNSPTHKDSVNFFSMRKKSKTDGKYLNDGRLTINGQPLIKKTPTNLWQGLLLNSMTLQIKISGASEGDSNQAAVTLAASVDEINQDGNMTTKTVTTIEDTNLIKSSSSISNICDNKSCKTTKKLALNFGRKRRPTKR